jgi:hypothetical protein
LAKYTYALLPLEQHHKIEPKKPLSSSHQNLAQQGFHKQTNQIFFFVLAQMLKSIEESNFKDILGDP